MLRNKRRSVPKFDPEPAIRLRRHIDRLGSDSPKGAMRTVHLIKQSREIFSV